MPKPKGLEVGTTDLLLGRNPHPSQWEVCAQIAYQNKMVGKAAKKKRQRGKQ